MIRRVLPIAVALLVSSLLAPPDTPAQSPRRGGTLRIAEREAPNLDPHLSVSFLTHNTASMVYSQLVRFPYGPEQKHTADFTIMPDLAEKWEYRTPTVLVFTLRKGVKFHNKPPVNGREVTAEDVKYSLRASSTTTGTRWATSSCSRGSTGERRAVPGAAHRADCRSAGPISSARMSMVSRIAGKVE